MKMYFKNYILHSSFRSYIKSITYTLKGRISEFFFLLSFIPLSHLEFVKLYTCKIKLKNKKTKISYFFSPLLYFGRYTYDFFPLNRSKYI